MSATTPSNNREHPQPIEGGMPVSLGDHVHDGTGADGEVVRLTNRLLYFKQVDGSLRAARYADVHIDGDTFDDGRDLPAGVRLLSSEHENEGTTLEASVADPMFVVYRDDAGKTFGCDITTVMLQASGPDPAQVEPHTAEDEVAEQFIGRHYLRECADQLTALAFSLNPHRVAEHYGGNESDTTHLQDFYEHLEDIRKMLWLEIEHREHAAFAAALEVRS